MMTKWEILPGETPLDDTSSLKLKDVRTRKQLALAEAENVLKTTVKYLAAKPSRRLAPFDLNWFLKLHAEMFGDVWEWAGKARQIDLNMGVVWHQVESELQNLTNDLEYWEKNWPDIVEQSVHLHHRAVYIHPFMNGNGRWARMLANIWLRLHDCELTLWPEQTIGAVSSIRDEYLKAIRAADAGGMMPLLELHRRFSGKIGAEDERL
jgi:Fic-DOC domain mobile mystery protein B